MEENFNIGLDLNEVLDISGVPGLKLPEQEVETLPPMILPQVVQNPDNIEEDINFDYQAIRQAQLHQLAMVNEVGKILVEVVRNQETPKVVDTFQNFLYTATKLNESILNNHEKMKKLKGENQKKPIQVEGQVISPTDLLEQFGTQQDYIERENLNATTST